MVMNPALELRALRGATTASANTSEAITEAVSELIETIARRRRDWDAVALLDCRQMAVAGDLPRCIRLLAHAWMEAPRALVHPYLREASRLRPDRARQASCPESLGADPTSCPADH